MTFHHFTMTVNGFILKLSGKAYYFFYSHKKIRCSNLTNKQIFSEYDIHEAGSVDMTGLGWLDNPEGTVSWGYNEERFQIFELNF